MGQKIKNSPGQKTRGNQINQFHEFFLTKIHFLLFQKWPKINFSTGKRFKIERKIIRIDLIFLL